MKDLRVFLNHLSSRGQLVEIAEPVDAELELAEIHRRVISANGPALFFSKVHYRQQPYRFGVVSNLFGSRERIDAAFGLEPQKLIRELTQLAQQPPSLKTFWQHRSMIYSLRNIGLRRGRSGPVMEERDDISLDDLPMVKQWSQDGGFFLTLPLVYTEHPDHGSHNLGMYRMQRYDGKQTGMHWQIHKGGGFHYSLAEKQGSALPVTVFLGGPPALILSAIAPLPENVGELLLTSLLQGKKLQMTGAVENGHPLVAQAEFALVGRVPASHRRPEGPFGDHYGYYSLKHPYPVFQIEHIYHRRDAILPLTVVGKPKQEDFFIGDYLQELLSPLFPMVMPGVKDLWSYGETGYHSLSAAVVQERYPREAMGSAFAILGQGQLSLTKFLLMLDTALDLKNFKEVLFYILERADFSRDLMIFDQLSMDTLDYTGPEVNKGSKAVLIGMGRPIRKLPRKIRKVPSWVKQAEVFVPGCLVIDSGKEFSKEKRTPEQMIQSKDFEEWPLVILCDNAKKTVASLGRFLWTVFTRFEPAADLYSARVELVRNSARMHGPILLDARMKPNYPDELFCDDATAKLVSERWNRYFPQGMEMGDSASGHLDIL